jgi:hypothetical protein
VPNRILKETICSSEDIENLTPEEEVFFYRLIVNCDDYGRIDARPKILKSKLYPLKDSMKADDINCYLMRLNELGMLILYIHDDKMYLQLTSWENHQQVRAKRSKCPPPTKENIFLPTHDIICNQVTEYVPENPNPNPNPNPNQEIYSQDSDICSQNGNQDQKTDFVEQSSTPPPSNTIPLVPYQEIVDLFNSTCTSLSRIVSVSKSRKQKIHNRWKELQSIVKIKELFEKVESTSFLKGNNNKGWKCSFDWLFENDSNWLKVMEGNYDSSEKNNSPQHKPANASFEQRQYSDDYYNSFYEDVSNKVRGGGESSGSN